MLEGMPAIRIDVEYMKQSLHSALMVNEKEFNKHVKKAIDKVLSERNIEDFSLEG